MKPKRGKKSQVGEVNPYWEFQEVKKTNARDTQPIDDPTHLKIENKLNPNDVKKPNLSINETTLPHFVEPSKTHARSDSKINKDGVFYTIIGMFLSMRARQGDVEWVADAGRQLDEYRRAQ
jgi:hypothetical protein